MTGFAVRRRSRDWRWTNCPLPSPSCWTRGAILTTPDAQAGSAEGEAAASFEPFVDASLPADAACPVTPRSILEALLFVGTPQNEPLTSAHVSGLMRGVRPQEIDALVVELNEQYDAEGCPYRIRSVGSGYQLAPREEYASLRDKFYGRVKEARLSPAAVEVLAVVAYRQPLTRDEIDALRGRPSGGVLAQLVRRQLLRIERPEDRPRQPKYLTTDRFLALFGPREPGGVAAKPGSRSML